MTKDETSKNFDDDLKKKNKLNIKRKNYKNESRIKNNELTGEKKNILVGLVPAKFENLKKNIDENGKTGRISIFNFIYIFICYFF